MKLLQKKIQGCQPNNDESYTESYQKHNICGYGYKVVCCNDDEYSKPVQIYKGENHVYKVHKVKWCEKNNLKTFQLTNETYRKR